MQILAMIMMMILMISSHSALATQSLTCHNDYHNTFSCVWNTSKLDVIPPVQPETICWIHVMAKKMRQTKEMVQMFADPAQPHIRSATVGFKGQSFPTISLGTTLHEEVHCDNYTNPMAEIALHNSKNSAVKAAPPEGVEVHGINASWSFVPPRGPLQKYKEFEVQYRSVAQSWKDVANDTINTNETQIKLPEDRLPSNQQYVIRVRVRYQKKLLPNAVWSDWSEEYNWTSTVGQRHHTQGNTHLSDTDTHTLTHSLNHTFMYCYTLTLSSASTEIFQLESSVAGITLTVITLAIILTL
ncbi:uncharacterized protein LOC113058201 [Carassius auratus]|uniref:Uncharacterized protein LOC113058201 n=1 Tax=Carassius auratus TaxID=7957 RepID=A0A6P6LAU8_CARAU|nr:uncharacterized protein LOC113058201 [Carassius auratus]XP_026081675.1 uncharacterized protein LOC113058201 [Carassius auratus]XP_026081676.1 uncharacterized protein LOC113058201 [Carassius auratus]